MNVGYQAKEWNKENIMMNYIYLVKCNYQVPTTFAFNKMWGDVSYICVNDSSLTLQGDIHEEHVNTWIVITALLSSVSLIRVVVMDDCIPALYVI